jgi:hypothetical protein
MEKFLTANYSPTRYRKRKRREVRSTEKKSVQSVEDEINENEKRFGNLILPERFFICR